MKKSWHSIILAAAVLGTVVIQTSFLGGLRPLGVIPNLFLIMVICVGLVRPASETLSVALGGGLLLDMSSGTDFGLRMGFYAVLALLVMVLVQAGVDLDNLGIGLGVVIVGTLVFNLCVLSGLIIARVELDWPLVLRSVAIEAALNSLFWIILEPVIVRSLGETTGVPQISRGA